MSSRVSRAILLPLVAALDSALSVPGFGLGPMLGESVHRAMTISKGSVAAFFERPIGATLIGPSGQMIVTQVLATRGRRAPRPVDGLPTQVGA